MPGTQAFISRTADAAVNQDEFAVIPPHQHRYQKQSARAARQRQLALPRHAQNNRLDDEAVRGTCSICAT